MFISARSFEEYRAMFALTEHDLFLRILDCPGGAAGFVAEAGARGVDAVAVDPQYGDDRGRLGELALREIEHRHTELVDGGADFVWTWFEGPEQYTRMRSEAARAFARDIAARPDRYVEGSLPHLPFPDRSFDLVLSSHLLFSYGEQMDEDFHRDALLELVRLSRWQVRLYPLFLHTRFRRYPALEEMREALAGYGIASRVEPVDYAFDPGDQEMLVLECADRGALPAREPDPDAARRHHDPVRWRHLGADSERTAPSEA
ncbi:methyltransferase domain-containing protein [Nocardiopsis sp. NPDC057823]|uniref:methyltransferase domain-containing protein n=1 Tax=Nocardiopsis sp. NPDC057823 TaxID=3346256 RepID=UPI00366C4918